MRFSKPACARSENGKLFGSAQTRSTCGSGGGTSLASVTAGATSRTGGGACGAGRAPNATRPRNAHETAATSALNTVCLEPEDIDRAPWRRVLLDVLHRADDAQ